MPLLKREDLLPIYAVWLLQRRARSIESPQAYCASPWPRDQFSFATSTRLANTSSGRMPGLSLSSSAILWNSAFFLFHGAGVVRGDLNKHELIASSDAKIRRAVAEVRSVMLPDSHELVIFWHVERFAQRSVKTVEDRPVESAAGKSPITLATRELGPRGRSGP